MQDKVTREFEFIVIAGSLKGRRITAPDLGITRPPLTRLRRAIFDFLAPYIQGCAYLDLYSGTGSYLFEAVSRGAASADGVELEPKLCDAINRQAAAYGVGQRLRCRPADVFDSIRSFHRDSRTFDVLMMAPPQYKGLINRTLTTLRECPLMSPDGIILCQHDSSETDSVDAFGFTVQQTRRYGNTTFTILTPGA